MLMVSLNIYAQDTSINKIKEANAIVLDIEKNKRYYDTLDISIETNELEGIPPSLQFLYSRSDLSTYIAKASTGHETFSIEYKYYIKNNQVLKYTKETIGRVDSPTKKAIIYNTNGTILWQNIDTPILNPIDVITLFQTNMKFLKLFSNY